MAKSIRSINIESEVYERFQRIYPNEASAFIEEALRRRLETNNQALEGINDEILAIKEENLQKIIDNNTEELKAIKKQRELIKNKTEDVQLKLLEEEKAALEKLKTCAGCGCQIGENSKRTPVGEKVFCHECFMNSHPAFLKALKESR